MYIKTNSSILRLEEWEEGVVYTGFTPKLFSLGLVKKMYVITVSVEVLSVYFD